jgi:hypothetical protein
MSTPILDRFPYDWAAPEAQELHIALCEIYPTSKGAMFVALKCGIPAYELQSDQPPLLLWKEILDQLANRKKAVRELVTFVRAQNPESPRRKLLDDLLANKPVITTPRDANGAPAFLEKNDTIGEPEALLYKDNLTLSTGRVAWLIGVLAKLQTLVPAVCRFECKFGDAVGFGTGFRIAPDLLLTNWHVLHHPTTKVRASVVTAEFGYEEDEADKPVAGFSRGCAVDSIVAHEDDDWGVIRVGELTDAVPIIALSAAAEPVVEGPAFLIQHPHGLRKRLGYVRNQVTDFNEQVLHYLTDTEEGSSGSPVFDKSCRLIGVHHVGGRPQEVAGKIPLKKNEGIRIPRIVAGLKARGIAVP